MLAESSEPWTVEWTAQMKAFDWVEMTVVQLAASKEQSRGELTAETMAGRSVSLWVDSRVSRSVERTAHWTAGSRAALTDEMTAESWGMMSVAT